MNAGIIKKKQSKQASKQAAAYEEKQGRGKERNRRKRRICDHHSFSPPPPPPPPPSSSSSSSRNSQSPPAPTRANPKRREAGKLTVKATEEGKIESVTSSLALATSLSLSLSPHIICLTRTNLNRKFAWCYAFSPTFITLQLMIKQEVAFGSL
jgi:hypothetical protein